MLITYSVNSSSLIELKTHLEKMSSSFFPPLAERVNIEQYALKIFNNAIRCEAWNENSDLIGLIACYANDVRKKEAFITNVSVLSECRGNGVAKNLFSLLLSIKDLRSFNTISLEVSKNSIGAIALYESIGFYVFRIDEESYIMKFQL